MAGKRQDIRDTYPSRDGQAKNTPGREIRIFISSELKQNKITRLADLLDLLLKRNMKRDCGQLHTSETGHFFITVHRKTGFVLGWYALT